MINPKQNTEALVGKTITLRPVVTTDGSEFAKVATEDTFRYFVTSIPNSMTSQGFEKYVDLVINDPKIQGYTVVLNSTNQVVGSTCFMDIRVEDFHVEIGLTWYTESVRGTYVNPECKLLLLTEAFEKLGAKKVTLKCDARNIHSQRAILKLGAKPEGVLRKHRFTEHGEFRDTAYFSILLEEWSEVKTGLQLRLKA